MISRSVTSTRDGSSISVAARTRLGIDSLRVSAALAAGVALVLGLVRLGTPSLWFDETYTAQVVDRGPRFWLGSDQYHFLYDGVLTAWAAVAGTSEWSLRFPSVVGTAMAAALMVVLADRLGLGRWVALVSGLFVATSPFVVKWSQQARSYTLLLLVCIVATLLLLRALERGTRGAWALYGLSISVAVVWHAVGGLLLVPVHALLIAQRRDRFMPHGLLAVVLASAIAVPWAATIALRTSGANAGINWLKAPSVTAVVEAFADVSGVAGLGVLLAAGGLIVLWRRSERELATLLGVWAVSPFVLALGVTVLRPVFLDRYLIAATPAFALLAAVAVIGAGRRLRPVVVACAVLVTAVALAQWYAIPAPGNWRGEDWRTAVATVLDRKGEEEPVLVAPWQANIAARYYGADPVDVSTAGSLWVITWSETGERPSATERANLGYGGHRLVERIEFGRRVAAEHWQR